MAQVLSETIGFDRHPPVDAAGTEPQLQGVVVRAAKIGGRSRYGVRNKTDERSIRYLEKRVKQGRTKEDS